MVNWDQTTKNHKRKYRKFSLFVFQGIYGISLLFKWIILLCIYVCEGQRALVDCLLSWKCWCSIFNAHKCAIKTAAFFWQTNASTLTTKKTTVVVGHNEQILQNVIFSSFSLCESLSRAILASSLQSLGRCRHRHHHRRQHRCRWLGQIDRSILILLREYNEFSDSLYILVSFW